MRAGAEGRSRALNTTAECKHNAKEFTSPQLGLELRHCLGKSVAVREDDPTFQKRRKEASQGTANFSDNPAAALKPTLSRYKALDPCYPLSLPAHLTKERARLQPRLPQGPGDSRQPHRGVCYRRKSVGCLGNKKDQHIERAKEKANQGWARDKHIKQIKGSGL